MGEEKDPLRGPSSLLTEELVQKLPDTVAVRGLTGRCADINLFAMGSTRNPPSSARRRERPALTGQRIRSVRGYRVRLDDLFKQALNGVLSWSDYSRAAMGIRASAELFMAEHLLANSGGDQEVAEHPLGDRGGVDETSKATQFRKKKIVARTGLDKFGSRIDDKTVTIETSAVDDTAETDAEIEALT